MDKKGLDRRAELTSIQIILLLLAIFGFVIVLAALFLVDLGGYSEDDICSLSVLTRATAPTEIQGAVPLKCRTEKICIREGFFGDACKEQFAGEEDVTYIRVSGTDEQKAKKIEEISANAMYDCWNTMGRGKLDLFNSFFGGQARCVICSRVAIDDQFATENSKVMKNISVDEYLKDNLVPGQSLTYLQIFTDRGVNSYSSFDQGKFDEALGVANKSGEVLTGSQYYDMAYVFSQIKSEDVGTVLEKMALIGGAAGAATFMSPVGRGVSKLIFTPAGIVVTVGAIAAAGAYGIDEAYQGQKAAAAYCDNYGEKSEEGEAEGCSVVQAVYYNFRDINKICAQGIEGEL